MQLTAVLTAALLVAAKGVNAVEIASDTMRVPSKNKANSVPNLRGADVAINGGGSSGGVIASDGDDEEAGRGFNFDDEEFMEGFADSDENDHGYIEEVEGGLDISVGFFENIVLEGCQSSLGGGCSAFKKCCSGMSCGVDFKCKSNSCQSSLGGGCSVFKNCCSGMTCHPDFKCHDSSCQSSLGGGCSAWKNCCDGMTCGGDFKCYSNSCQSSNGGGCSVFRNCCSGKSCHSNFKCYDQPRRLGQPCDAVFPCDTSQYYCDASSFTCQPLRTYGQSCDVVKKCDQSRGLECGDDFICHNNPRQPGEKCGPAYPCVSTHSCSSPTASSDPNTCKPRRDFCQSCDTYQKCASGLECGADFSCHNSPRQEGEACGPAAPCGTALYCVPLTQRCIKFGAIEAINDVATLFNGDSVLSSLLDPIGGVVTDTLANLFPSEEIDPEEDPEESVAISTASSACSSSLNDIDSIDACFKNPVDDLVTRFTDFIGDTESAIESKMKEISLHFQARLKYYQLAEYERLGIDPPQNLLDEGAIGFPGIMKVGVGATACAVVGGHVFAGFAFELWEVGGGGTGQRAGGYAGGGGVAGACLKASAEINFAWVFTNDNIANAGGHTLGGAFEVAIGPGVGIGIAVDVPWATCGGTNQFPAIEVSAGVGVGAGLNAGLVYSYEWADCFKGWNCEPCIAPGDPCVGDGSIPAGQCCYPRDSHCEKGGNFGSQDPDPSSCVCAAIPECSATQKTNLCSASDKEVLPFTAGPCSCMDTCPA